MTRHLDLLEAISFTSRAHRFQMRKDGSTPYSAHPMRVFGVVSQIFNVRDMTTLIASCLHDTIEDTTTDFEDIEERFGADVARIVAVLSKDSRQPEEHRESDYLRNLQSADDRAKTIKLGDIFDNLIDSKHLPPENRSKTILKARRLLDALSVDASDEILKMIMLVRNQALQIAESA